MSEFEDQFVDPFATTEQTNGNEGDEEQQQRPSFVTQVFPSCLNFKLAVTHEEMNSRRRNTMEDVHRILPVLDEALPRYSYIGIYDGHGGRQIVDFLEHYLEETIANELKQTDDGGIEERITR
jgi:hypothetical protein